MRQDRISGIALIAGSIMAILTMVLHPIGGDLRSDSEHLARIASMAMYVHVLAVVALCVQAFALLGFYEAMGRRSAAARAGLVAFVVSWIAVVGAAIASGIVGADLIRIYPGLEGPEQTAMQVIWHYNGHVNHALARVFIVATSVGMTFWSAVVLRHDRWWKALGALGILLAGVGLLSLAGGHLHIDVAGFGIFIFGYSAWTVALGALLLRPDARHGLS